MRHGADTSLALRFGREQLGDRGPLRATPAHELGIVVQGIAPSKAMAEEVCMIATELSPNFGDGLKDQAAAWA